MTIRLKLVRDRAVVTSPTIVLRVGRSEWFLWMRRGLPRLGSWSE